MSNSEKVSVKALIYRGDGSILMQQRDISEKIPFPGYWNFFGGEVEQGESLLTALERELIEELGCIPGKVEEELFEWKWDSDWAATVNHYFPVKFHEDKINLELNEGQAMEWLSLDELIDRQLVSGVYENFSRLAQFLGKYDQHLIKKIESKIISLYNLIKKNDRVFYSASNPCTFSIQQMFLLKELAILKCVSVFRVCMHTNDDSDVHEMLMVHAVPTSVGPLKQDKTSLSYHMIAGALLIKMYDKTGAIIKEYVLDKKDGAMSIRLDATIFRSVQTNANYAIFLEVASGPFKDNDTIWMYGRNASKHLINQH